MSTSYCRRFPTINYKLSTINHFDMSEVRVRFPPSPTGSPHVGNFRTAVFNWLFARHTGGKFIVRLEDTDRTRFVPESVGEILGGLRWLGLDWDEGPEVGGAFGPYVQSERTDIYKAHADKLMESGHAYRCYCTPARLDEMRKQREALKQETGYDGRCRNLSEAERARCEAEGSPFVIRLKTPNEGATTFHDLIRGDVTWQNALLDDLVLLKSDGFPTYHLASVVDDHLMRITHVIRGEDWISSTPRHVILYAAFGWDPPLFAHPPLILGPDRSKFSKRHGPVSFISYMQGGYLRDAMLNFLAIMGWSAAEDREIYTREELVAKFDLPGVAGHAAIFDVQKLQWMNGEYIRAKRVEDLADEILPYLQRAGFVPESPDSAQMSYMRAVAALIQVRIKLLSEAPEASSFFFGDSCEYDGKAVEKWLAKPGARALLDAVAGKLEGLGTWTVEALETAVREAGAELGVEGGKVVHPIRVAITGRTFGPGLFETMEVLGKERVLRRLREAPSKPVES